MISIAYIFFFLSLILEAHGFPHCSCLTHLSTAGHERFDNAWKSKGSRSQCYSWVVLCYFNMALTGTISNVLFPSVVVTKVWMETLIVSHFSHCDNCWISASSNISGVLWCSGQTGMILHHMQSAETPVHPSFETNNTSINWILCTRLVYPSSCKDQ